MPDSFEAGCPPDKPLRRTAVFDPLRTFCEPFHLPICIRRHRDHLECCIALRMMSSRLDKSWLVLVSHQSDEGNRCVDIFSRPDGTYGFEEFRRDPEDMGAWTPVSYFSRREYPTEGEVLMAARNAVSWLGPLLDR